MIDRNVCTQEDALTMELSASNCRPAFLIPNRECREDLCSSLLSVVQLSHVCQVEDNNIEIILLITLAKV